jgi:hypothetical protein
MSREAFEKIVAAYEGYDPRSMFSDEVCLHAVSKVMRGRSAVEEHDVQKCADCSTLMRWGHYEIEIASGPCDSEQSKEMLNGMGQGQLVAAYEDGDTTKRGGMSGTIDWQGSGAVLQGRIFAVLNAGTHHDPVTACEKCAFPGHAEGWMRAAVVEGDCRGCRVNGASTYRFDADEGGATFYAAFEGLLICQCHAD